MLQKNIKTKYIHSFLSNAIILLITLQISLNSTAQNISFKKLNLDNGLSQTTAFCINQDTLGRIWIGTRDGLNCWDGIRMKTFYPVQGDTTSILSHKTIKIHIGDKYLWALCDFGISRLDFRTMKFKRFPIGNIMCIGSYKNKIIAGTRNGLLIYNNETEQFEADQTIYPEKVEIVHIYEDRHQNLWLGNTQQKQLIKINEDDTETIPIPADGILRINKILLDSNDQLWIATRFQGLLAFNIETRDFRNINTNTQPYHLNNMDVRDIIEDKEGRLWAGSFLGLSVFDINKKTTKTIDNLGSDSHNISHNSVYGLYLSDDNNIWIGTYFGGINYGRVSNEVFKKYHNRPKGEKTSHNVIGHMIEDNNGNLWIATEGAGLDFFDRNTNTITNYNFTGDNNGPSAKNIKYLHFIDNERLLVGTYKGGLNLFNTKTGIFKHFNDPNNKNHPIHIVSIIEYGEKYLLGAGYGVFIFDPKTEDIYPFLPTQGAERLMQHINTMHIDVNNVLWMGTRNIGLISFDLNTKKIKHYRYNEFLKDGITSDMINCIHEDRNKRLWFGTEGGGLCLYNRNEDNFSIYNHNKNNIPSNFIFDIVESGFDNFWIATSKGLTRFDYPNEQFYNYTYELGFPLKELNYNGLILTNDNELFVGGVDGLISFDEEDLLNVNESLHLAFTGLQVNNKPVSANDETGILNEDISVTQSFKLKPEHTVFTINYSSFNYNNTFKNKYQYQLEGFDNDWVNAEFTSSVTYTNLNPGNYQFKVRATNVAYKPVSEVKTISIIVKPPITQTWYAFLFYILILLGIILIINYSFLSRIRLKDKLKNEMADKDRIQELNVQKLRFFTNITHEFLTPLTIILSSLESAMQKYKIHPKLKWHLNLVMKNAKHLRNLNSELLDFRKIEQGHFKLEVQENNLVSYMEDIFKTFDDLAKSKNIHYQFDHNIDTLLLYYDPKQLNKVFYNLLSNAFKHVPPENGKITLRLINQTNSAEIQVINNGSGISQEDIEKVFDRFFQGDSHTHESTYQGNGIGLALTQSIVSAHHGTIRCESDDDIGTIFTLNLLKGNKHFSDQELSDKQNQNSFSIDTDLVWMPDDLKQSNENNQIENKSVNKPSLLIVEDNNEIRSIIKSLFDESFHVLTAIDGLDGLEKALKFKPDIIVSDIIMPNLSGFDLCKKLKRNVITSHIPILLLTALDSEEDRTMAFKYGADSYCTKPFNTEMLIARIENLFNNRKIIREKYHPDSTDDATANPQSVLDNNFLKKAQKIVEQNMLNQKFNVDQFAHEMKMGRTIFYNRIKKLTGQTPNEYVQVIRLKKAAKLLISEEHKSISEIAYQVGFSSPKYFATAFKKHFGVTPSKYVDEALS